MLAVSVGACTATGVHIYNRAAWGPGSALYRAHFPKMKLKTYVEKRMFLHLVAGIR